jgi:tetratricopeptide (TPR) repeat protein
LIEDALLLALALAPRLLHGLAVRAEPSWGFPLVDEGLYWEDAARIASGGAMDPVFYRPPLLGYLLGGIVRLFGKDASAARFVLLALSGLAAPLTARLARPIVGRGAALLAGAFVALYAPAVFYGGEMLPASTVLLLDLAFLLALRTAEEGRRVFFAVAGFLLGLSALAWPAILAFLPIALLRRRRGARGALLLLAGVFLAIAPTFLHNLRGGDPVPISSNGGVNLYMGNHEGADGWSARAPELPNEPGEARRAAEEIAERSAGRALAPSEISSFWTRRALGWIASNPAAAAGLFGRKLYALINDRDISDNIDFAATEEKSIPLRLSPFRFGLLFALFLPGIAALRRSDGGRLLLLYGFAAAVPVLLFFVVGRFRLPLLPVLAIGAAAGLVSVARSLRGGPVRAAPALLLVVAALLVSRSSLFGIGEDRTWHYHYLQGDALYRRGDIEGATRSFEESLRRNDRVPLTMNALGYLYAERGVELDRAERLIRGAIAAEPERRRFYLDSLGLVLFRKGRLGESAAAFEEALGLLPPEEAASKKETLLHLADVRKAEGKGGAADSLRAEASRLAPR